MRPLVWFRSDLRLRDNPALFHAAQDATRGVVGVFIATPGQWLQHDWGPIKVDFIMQHAMLLASGLRELNIGMLFRQVETFGEASHLLLEIARRHECDAIYFNREYEINESRRDDDVAMAFKAAGLRVRAFHDQTLIPPGEIRTGEGRFYTVFTPFRKAAAKRLGEYGPPAVLDPPRNQADFVSASDRVPREIEGFFIGSCREQQWAGGETSAHKRLDEYRRDQITGYHATRDVMEVDGTSRLSPWLTAGAISVRQCLATAIDAAGGTLPDITAPVEGHPHPGPAVWISELIWREFYRHLLVGFPRLSMGRAFQTWTERIEWRDDPLAFDAWREGRTGVPIVDAAMRQLLRIGWMHNRARMIVAMYLTKHLLIDWRLGEQHFMRHLIDGDLANNNGGWQWAASTGTDAAPYFRIFNPTTQSRRYDPHGAYIKHYVPELRSLDAADIHDPPPLIRAQLGYPQPIVEHAMAVARAKAVFEKAKQ